MRLLQPLFALFAAATDRDLISIVSYRTFTRWVAAAAGQGSAVRVSPRKRGRPRTADAIRELVLRLGRETGWGYTRILGELRKLGVRGVSRTTVKTILKDAGLDPSPERAVETWYTFVRRHAATLWASDFLTVRTATLGGIVDLYVLFFIHVGTRRAFVTGISANPTSSWVTQQARNASMQMAEWGLPATHVLIDHDTKYTAEFDRVLGVDGCKVKRVGPRAPNLNAYAERFAQTLRKELLDHFVVLGERHLRHLTAEFLAHYNFERPHQGVGNVPLTVDRPPDPTDDEPVLVPFPADRVRCRSRLGGLLRHYHRDAA